MQLKNISPEKFYAKLVLIFTNIVIIGLIFYFSQPKDLDRISRALAFESLGMPRTAEQELLRVVATWQAPEPIRYKLAKIFYRGTDYKESEWLFKSVLGKNPVHDNEVRYYLWRIYQKRKRFGEADAIIAPLLKDPKTARAWELVGNVRQLQKDPPTALVAYEKAHQLDPKKSRLLLKMGKLYVKLNRPLDARASYEKGLELVPDDPRFYARLIRILGKGEDKLAYFQRLQEVYLKDPFFENTFIRIGEFYRLHGFYQKAVSFYQDFLSRYPDSSQTHFFLGLVLVDLGRLLEAGEHFRRTLEIAPSFIIAQYYSGIVSLRLGELDKAYENLKMARAKGYGGVPDEMLHQLEKTLHIYA